MANRIRLAVTGAVLLLAGGAALAIGLGAFGRARAGRPIRTAALARWATAHGWFWPAAAAVACAVAAAGAWWLVAQGRGLVLRRLAIGDTTSGATRMAARVAVRAVTADVAGYDGVRDARVRLSGRPARPRIRLRVTCDEDADLPGLARRIRRDALMDLRAVLVRDDITGVVVFHLVPGEREPERPVG